MLFMPGWQNGNAQAWNEPSFKKEASPRKQKVFIPKIKTKKEIR